MIQVTHQRQLVGRGCHHVAEEPDRTTEVWRRVGDDPAPDGGQRVQREFELGHDAEVAPAAAQRPEQLGLRGLRGSHHGAVGEDDLGRDEVVEGQAVQAYQVADPAAQGQARHARRVVGAAGHRQPVCRAGRVDTAPRRSAAGADAPRVGIDLYPAQQPQIDHEAVVADRVTGHAVAAAADRRREALVLRPGDRRGDVVAAGAARDHRRVAIGHRIERRAGDVVGRVVADQHRAAQRTLQPLHRRRHPYHRLTLRCGVACTTSRLHASGHSR